MPDEWQWMNEGAYCLPAAVELLLNSGRKSCTLVVAVHGLILDVICSIFLCENIAEDVLVSKASTLVTCGIFDCRSAYSRK